MSSSSPPPPPPNPAGEGAPPPATVKHSAVFLMPPMLTSPTAAIDYTNFHSNSGSNSTITSPTGGGATQTLQMARAVPLVRFPHYREKSTTVETGEAVLEVVKPRKSVVDALSVDVEGVRWTTQITTVPSFLSGTKVLYDGCPLIDPSSSAS